LVAICGIVEGAIFVAEGGVVINVDARVAVHLAVAFLLPFNCCEWLLKP
jgi:hypothetical protein